MGKARKLKTSNGKHPGGRPTKYEPRFCQMIEEHMRGGMSASSFASIAGVCFDTISEWKQTIPEFSDAIKRGQAHRIVFWEQRLTKASKQDAAPVIFALKNIKPDEWAEKTISESNLNITFFEQAMTKANEIARLEQCRN